jgi:hypothetical protein
MVMVKSVFSKRATILGLFPSHNYPASSYTLVLGKCIFTHIFKEFIIPMNDKTFLRGTEGVLTSYNFPKKAFCMVFK